MILKEAFFCTVDRPEIFFGPVGFFSATMRRRVMIRRALDAPITVVDCTYLQNVQMISEKFSEASQSRRDIKYRVLFELQK